MLLLLSILLNAIGIPRLWIAVFLGSLCQSPLQASLYTMVGAAVGNYLLFILARRFLRERIRNRVSRTKAARLLDLRPDIPETILIRQLPVPGILTTLALAVSGTSIRSLIIGSVIGWLPTTYLATFAASSAVQGKIPDAWVSVSLAIACLLLIFLKRLAKRRSPLPQTQPDAPSRKDRQ